MKFIEPLIVKLSLFLVDSGHHFGYETKIFYENMFPWYSRGMRKYFMTNFLLQGVPKNYNNGCFYLRVDNEYAVFDPLDSGQNLKNPSYWGRVRTFSTQQREKGKFFEFGPLKI